MNNQIEEAVKVLQQGGIVIFPTDTVYGIGCRIDNEEAVKKLFLIRRRPETKATPVLVADLAMAEKYLLPVSEDIMKQIIKPYWPGGLTVVLSCQTEKVPLLVRGGGQTIGVRMPNHKSTLALITGLGVPILGPSANFHGEATPQHFADLNPDLKKLVDFVVEGDCGLKQASTVVDCSQKPWKILREGAVRLKTSKANFKTILLVIDTTDSQLIKVGITIDGKEEIKEQIVDQRKSQAVLSIIEDLLKKHSLNISDISEIRVNQGPGSFTGLRVGIAIANTLGTLLKIPVNGKKVGELVDAKYVL